MAEDYPITLHALPVPVGDGHRRVLNSPFPIRVEHTESEFVVSDDVLLLYGHGQSLDEALEDYGATILDYYELLIEREEAEELASNERPHLDLLSHLFHRQVAAAHAG
jgi:hypothetical protein